MINRQQFALTFGTFAVVMHFIWGILVALGWAAALSGFVYEMHFMEKQTIIAQFSFGRFIGLLVLAFAVAYIASSIFAIIWNKFHK